MVEEYKYQDKRVGKDENDKGSLKNLVNKEFKEIEKKHGIGYRDDQEIRNAGRNICNKIINEIKNDKSKVYGQRALKPLTQLIRDLKEEYNNMKGMSLFTNNEDKINQVAQRIDNAENETLKRLKLNNTKQESRNLIKNSPMFSLEKKKGKQNGKDIIYDTGNIIFTKASNSARIDQALKGFFDNPNTVYEIDYSGCTNEKIKDKMTGLTLTKTCYLRYDKNQKTYTIRDKDGNGILNRAYIREGVKLIPAGVRQWQSYVEEEKQKRNLGNIDNTQINKLTKSMLKDMPSAGKLTQAEQEDLAKKTENRVIELLKKAKKLGYDLESECVTKKHVGRGHMELHLNSGSSEVDRTIRGNDGSYNKTLGEKLDDFIDSNEGEYKTYLTNRVKAKWQELDKLTKAETSNISKNGEKDGRKNLNPKEREKKEQEAEQHKQEVLYGIGLLEKMVDNYKETEGDSWLDSDDRKLVQIKQLIRNAKSSINNADTLDDNALINIFINPIWEKRASFKNTANTYKPQYNQFIKVFLGKKQDQISAIRSLGGRNRIFDNTETSFLAEEIEGNDDLGVKKPEIQKCINNIKNRTSMSIYNQDGSINQKIKGRYDNTYASAKKGTDSLITLFVGRGRLPENWKDEEKEVRKCIDNLKDKLNSLNNQCENISLSVDDMIKAQHEKRLELEQKENKTENDMKILQSLVYLEDNPNEARESYQKAIEINNIELKYGNLGQIVKGGLLSALGELGGGITGKNADIYNDIKGYGWFDLSDENAKIAGDLIGDILEEVVILAVAIAIGTVTAGAGTAAIMGARVTKWGAKVIKYSKYISKLTNKLAKPIGKILKNTGNRAKTTKIGKRTVKTAERIKNTKLGKNIIKIKTDQNAAKATISQENRAEILHLWRKENKTLGEMYKLGSLVNKESGAGIKTVSAIFEGTGFHLSSTAIHNAISGVDLTRGLNPFGYTEGPNGERISNFKGYIQSIAFLSILKVVGQPIQNLTQASLTSVLGEKISANTLGKILQNIGSITGEFGSLTVTDEAINVFFEGELKELTVEDAIHSIGMILGLRAYGKIKQIANLKIKEYNRNKKELKAEINGKKIIVNEDILSEKANEEIKKAEEELKEIKERISKIKTEIKEIEKQISKIENNIEITNHERLANEISDRRRKSNNGNNPERYIDNNGKPKNIPINKHYEGNIVDGKMIIIDKRTGKQTTIKFDAKKRINDLLGNDQGLEKLDIEIAERMILGIKNGHIEVGKNRTEAEKIVDGFPEENLEIVNLENGNYGVRRKTKIQKLRNQKAKLDNQLEGLKSEHRKKRTTLNKEKKSKNIDKKEGNNKKQEANQGKESETKKPEDIEKNLDELLSNANKGNYESIKLNWITKAKFEAGVYMEGIHRRFKNLSLKPNTKLPREFLRKMRESLNEFKTKCRNNLSEKYKKLVDRYNKLFEKKLREEGNELEIKKEEIDIIEKSSKTFGEYNHEFADIIRNNQNKIINLERIENMDSFINESFKFLKEEMGIDDPNLKIRILEGTEGIYNHYDRSTNTVYFSRNYGGKKQIYLKGGNKAETFGGLGHELNHYLQEVEIIKQYGKGNANIDYLVETFLDHANEEGLRMIERYRAQIDYNEPISERAIKYSKGYMDALEGKRNGTIFDEHDNIVNYDKYRNLPYEKESFDRGDILTDEYRKTTKSYKEQQRRQQEQQRWQREGNYSNEITNEIKKRIPDLLKIEPKSSINSEFSNNPELHQNFIKTKVLKNLINYVENITKSGENPDLIEVLRGSKEELSNISYEQRIELMNNINLYLKSVETANRFISIEKSGGVSAKELFLRAKGLDASEINKFKGNVTIEQFRNSVVFVFEKASDVQRFFGRIGNGNHFENKISGLDTIVINKENCKNAEKIGLKEEDAISRVVQHESQHAINEIFMSKDIEITYEEAMDSALTDINTVKEYALNRVKNEIIAQYTSRLFFNKLPPETITELSKGVGTKELLINPKENGPYDYFRERKNTQEGQKAREEYKKEVEKMCDYVDETLKSCKSNEEIQNMLNMFCTTDVKERKNIKDTVKSKEQQRRQREEQQRRERKKDQRKETEEKDVENNQLKFNDIEMITRVDEGNDKLGTSIQSARPNYFIKRNDVLVKVGNDRLCIQSNGKTYFIQLVMDNQRPANSVIVINKEIGPDACKTILEKGKIFEVYDGKIGKADVASHINEIIAQKSNVTHTQEGERKEKNTKKEKTKAQYETISSDNYPQKFPNFKRTDNIETDVPLLTNEDIAFSYDAGRGYNELTQNTKVPTFDIRGKVDEFIEKNGGERKPDGYYLDGKKIYSGKQICVYNEADDISHIICFHNDRGLSGAINIGIKGKVSQQDATNLLKYLQKNKILEINPLNGKISENMIQNLNATNLQNAIIKYFNEK